MPSDIDNVICNGKFLKKNGILTTINVEDALIEAQYTCNQIIDKFFDEHPKQKKMWLTKTNQ
jgi:hypothetical protein